MVESAYEITTAYGLALNGRLGIGTTLRAFIAGLIAVSALAIISPAVAQTAASGPTQMAALPSQAVDVDEHYALGAGDKVKVAIYGEDDLGGEFAIDGTGHIQLPLIGQLKAAGLTVRQFADEVTVALQSGYLKDPKVSVQVINYRPFYIIGEVNKPGEYPYENGLTVLRAVALAGGYTYRANDGRIYIRHVTDKDESSMPADASTRILPGDIVRVPERIF